MKKFLLSIVFFYILSLAQTSFFASLISPNKLPNLILISVILFIFFEKPRENFSFFIAFLGGIFIDILSYNFFGITVIFLLILTYLLKNIISSLKRVTVLWFSILSLGFLIIYNLFSEFISYFFQSSFQEKSPPQFNYGTLLSFQLIYNFILLLLIYYLLSFFKKYARSFFPKIS